MFNEIYIPKPETIYLTVYYSKFSLPFARIFNLALVKIFEGSFHVNFTWPYPPPPNKKGIWYGMSLRI